MPALPSFDFEHSLLPPGTRYLLGIDEVGRGPLAGPLTIGAFLLDLKQFSPYEFIKLTVRDSKKLTATQRTKINKYFLQNNFSFHTFSLPNTTIDQQGIAACLSTLIHQALVHFHSQFDFCLIDGLPPKQTNSRSNVFSAAFNAPALTGKEKILPGDKRFVIKGDAQCFSIAAASIVAKVDRDSQMDLLDTQYPQYGFKQHKGYGTKQHLAALKIHGPYPIHRLSYRPLAK